jgi:mannose-1-phosphate guanylyltransferase/mannose-6-phosphate isomerase
MNNRILPVLLCGGKGMRLWPVSNEQMPKPFLKFIEDHSFFQQTVKRVTNSLFLPPLIVCQKLHLGYVEEQMEEIGVYEYTVLLETQPRNTFLAIALAAKKSSLGDKNSTLLILPTDHYVKNPDALMVAIQEAQVAVDKGKIVVFGIKPTFPSVRYGYIKINPSLPLYRENLFQVESFIEKPSTSQAEAYFASNHYAWNMGIYYSKTHVLLEEIERFYPNALPLIGQALKESVKEENKRVFAIEDKPLKELPNISIDYALSEKTSQLAVYFPLECGWTDIGTWQNLSVLPDFQGVNSSVGKDILMEDCKGCLVVNKSSNLPVRVKGINNSIIAISDTGILVQAKESTEAIGISKHYRPWGHFIVLHETKDYKIKELHVNPYSKISLQLHRHRSEKWIVIKGCMKVTKGERVYDVKEGDTISIEKNELHRIENFTESPVAVIEVQMGDWLDENDIERFEDMYGRVKTDVKSN